MAEKNISSSEHHRSAEVEHSNEHNERLAEHTKEQAAKARQEKSAENIQKIKELAKAEAEASAKVGVHETPADETDSLIGVQHSLKANAYERTLARAQQKLSKPLRSFSKVAHNPVVDKISEVGAQTVARPSGLLGGGICSFIGSLILLYYSKHYGFRYNYLLLFVLFAAGFLIGAILELVVWFFYSRKHRYN